MIVVMMDGDEEDGEGDSCDASRLHFVCSGGGLVLVISCPDGTKY